MERQCERREIIEGSCLMTTSCSEWFNMEYRDKVKLVYMVSESLKWFKFCKGNLAGTVSSATSIFPKVGTKAPFLRKSSYGGG